MWIMSKQYKQLVDATNIRIETRYDSKDDNKLTWALLSDRDGKIFTLGIYDSGDEALKDFEKISDYIEHEKGIFKF